MRIFKWLLLIFAVGNIHAQSKIDELEQFEIRSYTPQLNGVKDLVFEARVDGLKEIIEKNLAVGKLNDLYFKVYWQHPNDFKIEVEGLPKGFKEVRDDLRQLIKGKLDFVIPEKISDRLQPYTLKVEPITEGKLLKAIDETYTLAVPEIDITFDKSGRMKYLETKMSANAVKTEFFHSPKSWSNNKLVLDKVQSISGVPGNAVIIINELEYANVNGFGMPAKLNIKNVIEYTTAATKTEKAKVQKKETNSVIRFSKYEINTGKASRFITEGILK